MGLPLEMPGELGGGDLGAPPPVLLAVAARPLLATQTATTSGLAIATITTANPVVHTIGSAA